MAEYSTTRSCTLFVGTWNLNGRVGNLVLFLISPSREHPPISSHLRSHYCLGCFPKKVSTWALDPTLHPHLHSLAGIHEYVKNLDSIQSEKLMSPSPDMFVLGFQEIVPLTAQQIVQTDPDKRSVPFVLSAGKHVSMLRQTNLGNQDS